MSSIEQTVSNKTVRETLAPGLKATQSEVSKDLYEKKLAQRGQFRTKFDLYMKVCQNILLPDFYYTRQAGYLMAFTTPLIVGYYCKFNRGRYLKPILLIASTTGLFANFHFQCVKTACP